jgi:3D-(3,5/4)-trihydroxycyclohexane-1,2-dione acylhydrolase (decyclizing)
VIAGGGVRYAGAETELVSLCDGVGIPVAETSAGKGVSAGAALTVGAIGHSGTRAANALAREADLVLAVGTRLIDLTTGSNSLFEHPAVHVVGLNVATADADKLGALPLVADARTGLRELHDALRGGGWRVGAAWRERRDEAWDRWRRDVDASLAGDPFTQGRAIRVLNEQASTRDLLVVASGTPHVDVHKLWDAGGTGPVHMEVGFSCMGHEIPAAMGLRYGAPEAGEVYALVGDGTYLMGGQTELVTAVQEGMKITVVVIENHGYQSIHALQRAKTARSFGLEFRRRQGGRLDGPCVEIDLAANAASLGCATYTASTADELAAALDAARRETRPTVVVVRVDPLALTLSSDCWWDVGVAEVSRFSETREARALSERGRAAQRYFG